MTAILEVIFALFSSNWKEMALKSQRTGFNQPVYVVCAAVWLCFVFVLSLL